MKYVYSVFFLIIIFLGKAQTTYTFDYKFLIRINNDFANKSQYLINSENSNYCMYEYNNEGKLFNYGSDEVTKFNHKIESGKSAYTFISSQKLTPNNELDIDHTIVEKIGENKYSIKCFSKLDNKKASLEITAKLKSQDKDLIRFYFSDLSESVHKKLIASLKEKLNGNYNFMIESYKIDYKNGFKISNSIKNVEKINLKMTFQN